MDSRLHFQISAQPTNSTCGPTCLHAVLAYHGDQHTLTEVIAGVPSLEFGGTLAVLLGNFALKHGYEAILYTYDLIVFDPSWFRPGAPPLAERLRAQMKAKTKPKLRMASEAYLEFIERGGSIRMEDMTPGLIRKYLKRSCPILVGLSSTYLYNERRELEDGQQDDIAGKPQGHFVVLCGYDSESRSVLVADPLQPNPLAKLEQKYEVDLDRVMCAIMLGIVTYDGNLLVIRPPTSATARPEPRS
jgi:Peptidase_C39 like family